MKSKNRFDFIGFAYEKLLAGFSAYSITGRTIPIREIYRLFGLLFRLNKSQTRMLLHDFESKYGITMSCRGVRIPNLQRP